MSEHPTPPSEFNFAHHTESELIDVMLDMELIGTLKGAAAEAEYYHRRAEAINGALARRALEDE